MNHPIYTPLQAGLSLYAQGEGYEAHERFEEAWRVAEGDDKVLLQALVQVAAAQHKASQANLRGRDKLLQKAAERLSALGTHRLGVDLVALRAGVARGLEGDAVPLPEDTAPAGVLYLHGFASGPGSNKAQVVVQALAARGIPVRVPDLNAGGFAGLTVTRGVEAVERLLFDRTLVVGSSLGAYMAALLASGPSAEHIRAMVLMAPAFDFARRLQVRFGAELPAWKTTGTALVEHHSYGGQHEIGYGLYTDALRHAPRPTPDKPTRVIQGADDEVVPVELVREVAAAAPPSWSLEVVPDDHSLAQSTEAMLAAVLAQYSLHCMEPGPEPHGPAGQDSPQDLT